ncbi:unnamed protein product [Pleuronectes platessa]|uniref:Uncharacterized protein n=1 Tax=Pleuronectes platessa TaxID=8262 RepID=A0A9N7V5M4_PLEPL|nr:unnamed protein product [Pleuronectes platessa]
MAGTVGKDDLFGGTLENLYDQAQHEPEAVHQLVFLILFCLSNCVAAFISAAAANRDVTASQPSAASSTFHQSRPLILHLAGGPFTRTKLKWPTSGKCGPNIPKEMWGFYWKNMHRSRQEATGKILDVKLKGPMWWWVDSQGQQEWTKPPCAII